MIVQKKILTVDDSSTVRKFARRELEGIGFDVLEAENGQEALIICDENLPDGILLDWNMPIMDGLDFLKALRNKDYSPQPKVIFCTTVSELDKIQKALKYGADEYIMKPFDKAMLLEKLKEVGLV